MAAQYKRNQVETAIWKVLARDGEHPPTELLHRLKRLLDKDRTLGRKPRSTDPEQATYAFYAEEAPGSGIEIWFSGYEAFALLVAHNLLEHGFPQEKAVLALRKMRADLEREHKRMLKLDPRELFDQDALERAASPGKIVSSSTDPTFLVITTEQKPAASDTRPLKAITLHRGERDLMQHMKAAIASYTILELTNRAHLLEHHLARSEPIQRGRAAT